MWRSGASVVFEPERERTAVDPSRPHFDVFDAKNQKNRKIFLSDACLLKSYILRWGHIGYFTPIFVDGVNCIFQYKKYTKI